MNKENFLTRYVGNILFPSTVENQERKILKVLTASCRHYTQLGNKKLREKQGQVWMETLLYTAVGLAIIGVVLSFTVPKLEQNKERALVSKQIADLKRLDAAILDIANSPIDSTKTYELSLERGALIIDGLENSITSSLESSTRYSEPGVAVQDGRVSVLTTQIDKKSYRIVMRTTYQSFGVNLTANRADKSIEFTQAPTPYVLEIGRERGIHVDAVSGKTIIRPYVTISEQRTGS